jgi:hypothetical protein
MKLLCIKRHTTNNVGRSDVPGPDAGDEVTAVGEKMFHGELHYRLEEYYEFERHRVWFNAKNFVRLDSDLDETTLVTEEFNEKYCVPVNESACR